MPKLILLLLLLTCASTGGWAQRVTQTFRDVPMPEALKAIAQQSRTYTVNFLYNELEDFRVTASVQDMPVEDAIRQVVGFYPIQVKVDAEHRLITVECLQPKATRYMGVVVDEQGQPLQYANVALLDASDSTFLTGGVTNQSGRFVIPCRYVHPLLRVSHVGYQTLYNACPSAQVGQMQMQPSVNSLELLAVSGRRLQPDERGYTLLLDQPDLQTLDLLTTLPHLSIRDNAYCIDGQPVSAIYVDGQPIQGLNELCHLSGDMISRVRVDYLPRTIHITLRRPHSGGFYGSVDEQSTLAAAKGNEDWRWGALWHSRHGKLSIYDHIVVEGKDETLDTRQQTYGPGLAELVEGYSNPYGREVSNRLSLTQQFNPRHSLGASYYVADHQMAATSNLSTPQTLRPNTYYEGSNRHTDLEGTLRYDALVGRRALGLHLIYDHYRRQTRARDLSLYGAGVGTESNESPTVVLNRISFSLELPRRRHLSGLVGIDGREVSSVYDPDLFVSNFHGVSAEPYYFELGGTMINYFGQVQGEWQRLRLTAGVDMRLNSTSKMYDVEEGPPTLNQVSVDPHVQLLFPLGQTDKHQLTLGYQHQLEDIPYAAMLPYIRWSDAYNYSVGNPDLKAPSEHRASVQASLWHQTLNLSATYRQQYNEIYWQTFVGHGQQNAFYTLPTNLGRTQTLSLHAEGRLRPLSCWQLKAQGTLDLRPEDATLQGIHYGHLRWHQDYQLRSDLQLPHHWSVVFNASVQPTWRIYDRTYHALYDVRGQVVKGFLRNRLQCSLQVDMLGNRRRLDRQVGDILTRYSYTTPVQMLGMGLSWHFASKRQVQVEATQGQQQYQEIRDK